MSKIGHRHRPYRQGGKPIPNAPPEKLPDETSNKAGNLDVLDKVARVLARDTAAPAAILLALRDLKKVIRPAAGGENSRHHDVFSDMAMFAQRAS